MHPWELRCWAGAVPSKPHIALVPLLLEILTIYQLGISPCLQTYLIHRGELTCACPRAWDFEVSVLAGCSGQMAGCNRVTSLPRL